jgi:hypothetical protein
MWPSCFVIIAVETRDLQMKMSPTVWNTDSSFDNKHFKILGFSDKSVDPDLSFTIFQYVRSLKPRL